MVIYRNLKQGTSKIMKNILLALLLTMSLTASEIEIDERTTFEKVTLKSATPLSHEELQQRIIYTDTFQPPLNDDLRVNKIYIKATHRLDQKQTINVNFITIDDNLMDEVDGGYIFGIGYRYKGIHLNQYMSRYQHFDTYQTDLKYTHKMFFDNYNLTLIGIGKYIHLSDKDSNTFSKNAKEDYLSIGIKAHLDYDVYHIGVGGFFGKRAFAVMFDGFRVQHHAMEFENSYRIGIGRTFGNVEVKLKYVHQKAIELPMLTENVKSQNIITEFNYKF